MQNIKIAFVNNTSAPSAGSLVKAISHVGGNVHFSDIASYYIVYNTDFLSLGINEDDIFTAAMDVVNLLHEREYNEVEYGLVTPSIKVDRVDKVDLEVEENEYRFTLNSHPDTWIEVIIE